jgi:hypothetical protein
LRKLFEFVVGKTDLPYDGAQRAFGYLSVVGHHNSSMSRGELPKHNVTAALMVETITDLP